MNTSVFGSSEPLGSLEGHDAAPRLAAGSVIQGKYLVHGVLGLGGFAVVYDAEHVGLGRPVAIKVLHLAAETPLALLERFRREARISALAHHANVLEVYDTGTLPDGSPFLVMERLNGQTLSRVLCGGTLPLAAAVEVVRQLLGALGALAEAGVVHRDIKPDNLMLHDAGDGRPVLKLVDFGISKRVAIEAQAKLTCHGTLVGTPQYMSPEQIRGQDVDVRTDLYATGAVLYEALSGHAPHECQNFSELVVAVLNAPLRPLRELRANCPPELERIVNKALSRSPSQRYATPREMLAELDACACELGLPVGADAFAYDDPIDPIWTTPARISLPALRGWWRRGASAARRPLQLVAGLLLLAAPGAALQLYGAEAPVAAVTASVVESPRVGNPSPLPPGREPPAPRTFSAAPLAARCVVPPLLADSARDVPAPLPSYVATVAGAASSARLDVRARAEERRAARAARAQLAVSTRVQPVAPEAAAPPAPDAARRASWEQAMDGALASMVRGELQAAKTRYLAATRLLDDEPDAFRGLALVCTQLGEHDQARSALQRYRALSPAASDAAALEARVNALPR